MTRRERSEVVEKLVNCALLFDANRHPKMRMPGQLIARLDAETRKALEELSSADFQHWQGP